MVQPKVSVYVPVYNVEKYIERCARSLFEQTLDDMEFIFVNDCTPDKSVEILISTLNEYPNRIPQTTILHHEKNKGIAATRTTGLLACKGQYVIACDSDDWVELDMYEKMYEKAITTLSDIVQCFFFHELENKKIIEYYEIDNNPIDFLISKKHIWLTTWNKLINRHLITNYNIIPFPGINMYEDVGFIARVLCHSNKITTIPSPLYHYNRTNTLSILSQKKYTDTQKKLLDRIQCINLIESYYKKNNFNAKEFIINEKESIIEGAINTKNYLLLKKYPEMLLHFLCKKDLPLFYRFLVSFAIIGISTPLEYYSKFSSIRKKH